MTNQQPADDEIQKIADEVPFDMFVTMVAVTMVWVSSFAPLI